MVAVAYCLAISTLYVASLYVWRVPASRQHPTTVRARMVSVLLTCCVAWLPAWHMHRKLQASLQATSAGLQADTTTGIGRPGAGTPNTTLQPDEHTQQLPELLQLLGLHVQGQLLLEAALKVTALTLILFLGPLHHKATTQRCQYKQLQTGSMNSITLLHKARDYVVSPLTEEWCFRACMVPLLWLQGFGWKALIFMTPLFFGVCHLHHLWGLMQVYGLSAKVVAMCLLQFLYTTVFGWLVTWILLSTGSTLVAVLAHSICNMMGFPPFGQMSRASIVLCIAGVALFGLSASKVLTPAEHCRFWWARVQHQLPAPQL